MSRTRPIRRPARIGGLLFLCAGLLAWCGCPPADSPQGDGPGDLPPKGTELTVLVVGDPPLAAAVKQSQGEWNAQTGSDFRVDEISPHDLIAADKLPADVVICPSGQLGMVAANHGLLPLPTEMLEQKQRAWLEVFGLVRTREAVWGKKVVGVPFGSPVLTIYYRADLLESLGRKPPHTWTEYRELAESLSDRAELGDAAPGDDAPWYGAVEPLGPGWAGLVLLARAAPYAAHRENYSTLFHIDTMKPLIHGPPFVRALEELAAVAALGPPEQLTYDPAAARTAFWQGRCGLALSWPTAAERIPEAGQNFPVGLAELPGSPEAYDVAEGAWERRREGEDPRVPLLGVAGRMGLVGSSSKWPKAAFRLLFWLADEQSTQTSPRSPHTTLFRSSQVQSPQLWVEEPLRERATAARQYAELTRQTLNRPQGLFALRIPGRGEYLAALDEAVHRAVRGEQTPQESLRQAAARWEEITEKRGRDGQQQAYWDSLGLD